MDGTGDIEPDDSNEDGENDAAEVEDRLEENFLEG